jgi:hypothetical protein
MKGRVRATCPSATNGVAGWVGTGSSRIDSGGCSATGGSCGGNGAAAGGGGGVSRAIGQLCGGDGVGATVTGSGLGSGSATASAPKCGRTKSTAPKLSSPRCTVSDRSRR